MSRHLVEWLLHNPIDLPPVENVGTDRAWRVLIGLADYANETTGLMWASDRTQEKHTGLERRGVIQPVRQALEAAGWFIDTGKRGAKGVKVYELRVPGYSRPISSGEGDLATKKSAEAPSGVASGVGSGVGSGEGDLAQTKQNGNTPLTPQRGKAGEWGSKHDEVLSGCITWERAHLLSPDRGGLQKTWEREYRPIVIEALSTNPAPDLVAWCVDQRQRKTGRQAPTPTPQRTAPQVPQGSPDCEYCAGVGHHQVRDAAGVPTTRLCACSGGTYTGEGEAQPPAPQVATDPTPDQVKQLARRLRIA